MPEEGAKRSDADALKELVAKIDQLRATTAGVEDLALNEEQKAQMKKAAAELEQMKDSIVKFIGELEGPSQP
jgi:hypothetical protein